MAVEIPVLAMEECHNVHPQLTKPIRQFAIKSMFVLWG